MCHSHWCNKAWQFGRVSIFLLNIKFYKNSSLSWKNAVDEAITFYEDEHLPSIIVQNKVDLLPEEEQDNDEELKKFSEDNGFNGYFRTSAKTGKNIEESMNFLINEIIKKLEELNSKGSDELNKDRGSVPLDPEKHNKEADLKRKKENSGCCWFFCFLVLIF